MPVLLVCLDLPLLLNLCCTKVQRCPAPVRASYPFVLTWWDTESPWRQDNITRAGAIPPLISLLDRVELRELAAAVLAKLAHEHEDNQSDAWWQWGGMPGSTRGMDLCRLRIRPGCRLNYEWLVFGKYLEGAVPKLIKLLSDESPSIRETSAGLLHALVAGGHGKNVLSISRSGGIRPSLELLKDQNPGTREDATGLLSILATNADNRAVIAKMGAIPLLIDVVNDTDSVAPAARHLGRNDATRVIRYLK
eukprot:s532_g21.t2